MTYNVSSETLSLYITYPYPHIRAHAIYSGIGHIIFLNDQTETEIHLLQLIQCAEITEAQRVILDSNMLHTEAQLDFC